MSWERVQEKSGYFNHWLNREVWGRKRGISVGKSSADRPLVSDHCPLAVTSPVNSSVAEKRREEESR